MATLVFDRWDTEGHGTKLIVVKSPDTELLVQELYDKAQDWMDEPKNMDAVTMISGSGKEPLGGEVYVGLTVSLLDGWQVWFETLSQDTGVTGGNLVAFDAGGSEISPIANENIVKLTSSASATLVDQETLRASTFQGGVTIDTVDGVSGTDFPIGTPDTPVDNIADAKTILAEYGWSLLYVRGTLTVGAGSDLDDHTFYPSQGQAILDGDGGSLDGILCYRMVVTGALGTGARLDDCVVQAITGFNGTINRGTLETSIEAVGTSSDELTLTQVASGNSGGVLPFIDLAGDGPNLVVRGWTGDLEIRNKTGAATVSMDVLSGSITLASTVSAGTITIRGAAEVIDNSTGTAVVDVEYLLDVLEAVKTVEYEGSIWFADSGGTGTEYPMGTRAYPLNNWDDIVVVAAERGIKSLRFAKSGTLTLTSTAQQWSFRGKLRSECIVNPNGQNCNRTEWERLRITGNPLNRLNVVEMFDVHFNGWCSYMYGFFTRCTFQVGFWIEHGTTDASVRMFDCVNGSANLLVAGGPLDFAINTTEIVTVHITNWVGPMWIEAQVTPNALNNISITCLGGADIEVDSSFTRGRIFVAGDGFVRGAEHGWVGSLYVDKTNLTSYRRQSFNEDAIWIDTVNGVDSTTYPYGQQQYPTNSLTNALAIAANWEINKFKLKGSASLAAAFTDSIMEGWDKPEDATLDLNSVDVSGSTLCNLSVTGIQGSGGLVVMENCDVAVTSGLECRATDCRFDGSITPAAGDSWLRSCVAKDDTSVAFSLTGWGNSLWIDGWRGGSVTFNQMDTAAAEARWNGVGEVVIAATCDDGSIHLAGVADLTDSSTGTSVDKDGLLTVASSDDNAIQNLVADQVWEEELADHSGTSDSAAEALADTQENTEVGRFGDGVTYDAVNGVSGTAFPIGTRDNPVDNFADANTIQANFNLPKTLYVRGTITFGGADNVFDWRYVADSGVGFFNALAAPALTQCTFIGSGLTIFMGTATTGNTVIENCVVASSQFAGFMKGCQISNGTYAVNAFNGIDCVGLTTPATSINADFTGASPTATFTNWIGNLTLRSMTTVATRVTISMLGGVLTIDATCTDGEVLVTGIGEIVDNSNGTSVVSSGLVSPDSVADQTWEEAVADHSGTSGSTAETLVASLNQLATRKDIDIAGDDALGWQEVYYDVAGSEVGRLTLHEEDGTRITGTVEEFIDAKKMIGQRRPVP